MGQGNVPVLEIDGLTKQFGELVAVDDVSFSIDENEYMALIGPNGAGKTTFLNMLAGELEPTEGSVGFHGEDITSDSQHARCRKGIVKSYQIASVFPGVTVRENVRLGVQRARHGRLSLLRSHRAYDEDFREVEDILADVGLADRADARADTLSHGETRRLDIAITLATDAEVLLFDEPLAGLNESEQDNITELINGLAEEFTVVLVEHDVNMVLDNANRIAVMHQGQIIADGDRHTVISDEKVQEAYLGRGIA